jgi:hypothetical protein
MLRTRFLYARVPRDCAVIFAPAYLLYLSRSASVDAKPSIYNNSAVASGRGACLNICSGISFGTVCALQCKAADSRYPCDNPL